MRKYLPLAVSACVCAALIPVVALARTTTAPTNFFMRPTAQHISRRQLESNTWSQRAFLNRRGVRGAGRVIPSSSASSTSSSASSTSSTSSTSSSTSSSASSK